MSRTLLVCFAVKEEARPFQKLLRGRKDVRVLVTGMGAGNAKSSIHKALDQDLPEIVFSCGFAGALDPDLPIGTVVFEAPTTRPEWTAPLLALGARAASFICAERVAITAAEKSALRRQSGCDAVEMESKAISAVCAERGVDCITLRVISDAAQEDLPLDFNSLMTPGKSLSFARLVLAVLKAPHKIPALIRLGRNSATAARQLASVLNAIV
jgi:adenosylhomocysteine nucleosidase